MRSLLGLVLCVSLLVGVQAGAFTIDFDALASGTTVTTTDGVGFSGNVSRFPLVVSSGFDTTSGSNYLGVGDGATESFLPGDIVTLTLPTPVQQVSAAFVSSTGTAGGVFSIGVTGLTVSSGATADAVLGDGSEVFLVTLVSPTPFSSADLSSAAGGLFAYNIDDIVVPEPGLLPLGLAASLALALRRTRRASR